MQNLNIPRPEHPNPQWERANWKNLNGTWDFEIDNACSGEFRGLIEAPGLSGKITVPFCPESSLSALGKHYEEGSVLQYSRSFTLPEGWNRGRVLLHIGAADQQAEVFVNGKPVSEGGSSDEGE